MTMPDWSPKTCPVVLPAAWWYSGFSMYKDTI